jgi:predicted house-cleaning noncanonical NTP pyrophosphatase (MazG superfamily)
MRKESVKENRIGSKLVRDGVPTMGHREGVSFRVAEPDERLVLLYAKVTEEMQELMLARSSEARGMSTRRHVQEECGDLLAAVEALFKEVGVSIEMARHADNEKSAVRGGFARMIVMSSPYNE